MTTRTSLWEFGSSLMLIGMGGVAILSPAGLQSSTFLPAFREAALPAALFVFSVGLARLVVLLAFYRSKPSRYALAVLAFVIWVQWVLGFALMIPAQGIRPGMAQNFVMAAMELMFIIHLMKGRWSNGSAW